ncbi:unnamed protein product, partial [marine sediment metagenome]
GKCGTGEIGGADIFQECYQRWTSGVDMQY